MPHRVSYRLGRYPAPLASMGGEPPGRRRLGLRLMYRVLAPTLWVRRMIVSYRDRRTRDLADGEHVKAFSGISRAAGKKLDLLEAATTAEDLAGLRGNRFEKLSGNREGQYSIRINDKWRICFEWPAGAAGPSNVEIVDYH